MSRMVVRVFGHQAFRLSGALQLVIRGNETELLGINAS
jgi:hypothetical protein